MINLREGSASFLPVFLGAYEKLAPDLRARVELRSDYRAAQLLEAYTVADACRPLFDKLFGPSLDVVLTPAAPGEAPEGLHRTGDWVFNEMWTLLHVPCVAIPVGRGPRNLPVGIQLVGPRLSDMRLLAIAKALAPIIDTDAQARLRELSQRGGP
jgi:Asp-tRNA(Asn)/Glu-tRNA(Gln) amidotransferase A subunit family amidase